MKPTSCVFLIVSVLCPFIAYTQSTMEFQSGTHIEVTSGADICADNVIIGGTYSGAGTQCGGALPVELVSFAADASRDGVTLRWTTATETDNHGFVVERRMVTRFTVDVSGDRTEPAFFPWVAVGSISGAGTSSTPREYSFTDGDLTPGRYAYRIKQINYDGSFMHTDATEVDVGMAAKEFTLDQNFPNPFNPTTTIEFTLEEDGQVLLALFDAVGRQLTTLIDEDGVAGRYYHVVFDGSQFSSGTYFYHLESGGKTLTRKMMLVK